MISRHTASWLLTGILAGTVFSAYSNAVSGSFAVIYFPVLLLSLLGLSCGKQSVAKAALLATVVASLLGGGDNGFVFIMLVGLPCFYFTARILRYREDENVRHWYPALRVISELTGMATVIFLIYSVVLGHDGSNLQSQIARQLTEGSGMPTDPQMQHVIHWLTGEGMFVLIAWAVWIWILLFYAMAALANMILGMKHANLRPSLAMGSQGLPFWLLAGLVISILLTVLGQGTDPFIGKSIFLILLLPYLLCGLSGIHGAVKRWPGGNLWLILIYGLLIVLPWLAAAFCAYGLYIQLSEILGPKYWTEGRR